jgi:hypothetical protein
MRRFEHSTRGLRKQAPTSALLMTTALLAAGCTTLPRGGIPAENILMANPAGEAIDPSIKLSVITRAQPWEKGVYDKHLDTMFASILKYCRSQGFVTKEKPCKILMFMHGGLNTRDASLRRAVELTRWISNSGSYPIFVNWDSGFPTSYRDHLFKVHKGIYEPLLAFVAPVQLAMDLGSAIAEAPAAWFAETRHTFTFIEKMSINWKAALGSYAALQDMQRAGTEPSVDINEDLRADDKSRGDTLLDGRTRSEKIVPGLAFVPTLPTKLLAPPFALQAMGSGAWDVMYRRTAVLFITEKRFNVHAERESKAASFTESVDETNAVPPLLRGFIDRFEQTFIPEFCGGSEPKTLGCPQLELTLVGHSMGSIIIDQWLRYAPTLEIRNIVYMAGATSVNDYRDTVYNYLDRQRERRERKTEGSQIIPPTDVYHLVLHPSAEISERGFGDLAPRGSLLVWIDNYFSRPLTPLDRTVGRFFNLMPELARTRPELRSQIHVKVFRVGEATYGRTDPQIHGDFSQFPFWDSNFWKPKVLLNQGPFRCVPDAIAETVRCDHNLSEPDP